MTTLSPGSDVVEGTSMGAEMGKIVRHLVLAWLLLLEGVSSGNAQLSEQDAQERASKFVDQVVRVIPQRVDGNPAEEGFGLIVGERAGKIYIATPHHVAFGPDRPSSVGATPGVVFRGNPFNTIQAKRLNVASVPDDLAVLEVSSPAELVFPRAPMVPGAELRRGTYVWNIGIGQKWDMPDRAGGLGPLDVITGFRRVGSLRTPPGASGGVGVTDKGVIGIVLQDSSDSSWLLPVERVVQLFAAWSLPTDLLTSPTSTFSTPAVAVPQQGIEELKKLEVVYWKKNADHGAVEKALAYYDLKPTVKQSGIYEEWDFSNAKTDTVTCSGDVSVDAVRVIALALFDEGIYVHSITEYDSENSSIHNRITIESTDTENRLSPLSRKQIEKLSECPKQTNKIYGKHHS